MTNSTTHLPHLDMERIDQMASLACALPQDKPAQKWHAAIGSRIMRMLHSLFATPTRQTASGLALAFASIVCVVLVSGIWTHHAPVKQVKLRTSTEYSVSEYMIGDFLDEII